MIKKMVLDAGRWARVAFGDWLIVKRLDIPPVRQTSTTFKRARKARVKDAKQGTMFKGDE